MLNSIKMAFRLHDAKKAEDGMLKATSIWVKTIDSVNDSIPHIENDNWRINYNKAFSDFLNSGDRDLHDSVSGLKNLPSCLNF